MRLSESLSFDRVADEYDATRGGVERGRHMAEVLAANLATGRVLEIGIGTGAVALPLRELGHHVVGVDLSPAMLARALERVGTAVAVADGYSLPVPTAAVDTAYLVWVLQLVPDPAGILAEAARVTRPGGRVLVVLAGPIEAPDELNEVEGDVHTRLRPDKPVPATVIPMAAQAGLRLVVETTTPEQAWELTPAELVRRYEQRLFASAWLLDEDELEAIVGPVVARLRGLPDQERPRTRRTAHPLLVFERT